MSCIIVSEDNIKVICNNKVANVSFSVLNDGVHDSWLNSSVIEFLVDVDKTLSVIKVNIPENDEDKSFRKEFFKTSLPGRRESLPSSHGKYSG